MSEDSEAPSFGWDRLLREIRRGQVVPVVGPELLPYNRSLARAFAQALHVNGELGSADLSAVADAFLLAGGDLAEAEEALESLLEGSPQPPSALQQLATIGQFNLFITTDYSSLLEDALALSHPGQACQSLAFSRHQQPEDIGTLPPGGRCVYHLLGHLQRRRRLALARVDQLEYFYDLQTERGPKGLLSLLCDRRNLLFLGCDFPEWLGGFFMRTLIGKPLYDRGRGLEVIASQSTQEASERAAPLTAFLRANRMEVYPGDAANFVGELVRRYVPPAANTSAAAPTQGPETVRRGKAFVSYSRRDRGVVANLVGQLRARQVDVWFDEHDITPGDHFEDEIRLAICDESSAFIPVLSRNSLSVDASYFVKEWKWALDAQQAKMPDVKFIFPVVIDKGAPDELLALLRQRFPAFANLHVQHSPNGEIADDRLVEELRNARRRFERSTRRGA